MNSHFLLTEIKLPYKQKTDNHGDMRRKLIASEEHLFSLKRNNCQKISKIKCEDIKMFH